MNPIDSACAVLDEATRISDPGMMQARIRDALVVLGGPRRMGAGAVPSTNIQGTTIHPPVPGPWAEPLWAPDRYLVLENTPSVAVQTTSAPIRLEFSSGAGWLIGWSGVAVDLTVGSQAAGTLEQATMGVQWIINAGEDLITNGIAEDFAIFATLFRQSATDFTSIMRYVNAKDTARFRFRNFQPVGGRAMTPFLTFQFLRDPRAC